MVQYSGTRMCSLFYLSAQAWSIGELVMYHPAPMWGKLKFSLIEKFGGILEGRKSDFSDHSFGGHKLRTTVAIRMLGAQIHGFLHSQVPYP